MSVFLINDFSYILWKKWEKGVTTNEIIGHWAEDGTTYTINCPPQIRDGLLNMQHIFSNMYIKKKEAETNLINIKAAIHRVFNM